MGSSSKLRVLIVDALPLTRIGLASLISGHAGWSVCGQTGEANVARRLCAEQQPDLIVLDMVLDQGDGLELLRDFSRLHPPARTLVISGREDAHSMQRAFKAGARGFLSKHDDAPELLSAIETVLAGGLAASHRV